MKMTSLSRLACRLSIIAGFALSLFCLLPNAAVEGGFAPAFAQSAQTAASLETLTIGSPGKANSFEVEIMRTPEQRARGLMFRNYMPQNRGMLFEFGVEEPIAMWMKDTFIPLDMVFIRRDGTISRIEENTEPHSTRTISSGGPVYAVLELNGGIAASLGIKPGDKVTHPLFKR